MNNIYEYYTIMIPCMAGYSIFLGYCTEKRSMAHQKSPEGISIPSDAYVNGHRSQRNSENIERKNIFSN